MFGHRLLVEETGVARTLGVVHGPTALPIEDDGHFRLDPAADHGIELAQGLAQRLDFTTDPGIDVADVIDHGTVELLHRAAALAPLEVLHRIGTMSHRLQRGEDMHPRLLQLADGLPVGQARGGLHQEEGLAPLEGPHQVVIHGGVGTQGAVIFGVVPQRVAVPGDEVDDLGQLPVVIVVEVFHEVGGGRQSRIFRLQGFDLFGAEVADLGCVKALPIQIQTMDRHLALGRR